MGKNYSDKQRLKAEISIVQIENFSNKFKNHMKKNTGASFKRLGVILSLVGLSFASVLLFPNIYVLISSLALVTGTFTVDLFVKEIRHIRNSREVSPDNTKVVSINKEEDIEEVLEKENMFKHESEFFKPNIVYVDNEDKSDDRKKFEEAFEKQMGAKLELVKSEELLNKEETKEKIFNEIAGYFEIYNFPHFEINENDWDVYFGTLWEKFAEKGLEYLFYDSMSILIKLSMAKILVYKNEEVSIRDFIENIYYLNKKTGVFAIQLSSSEIDKLREEMYSKITPPNVIEFKKK